MTDDVWLARSAAFLRVFLPVREWVAAQGVLPLAEHVAQEELGLTNLHAVVTERRYLGAAVPALPEELVQPLGRYLDELPGYAPDLRSGGEQFSAAARQHTFVIMGVPRPLQVGSP